MTTDPVADLLTRLRNANLAGHPKFDVPASRQKAAVLDVLKKEGFISDYMKIDDKKQGVLRVSLKYGFGGEKVLKRIDRVSKPGCRVYRSVDQLGKVLDGLGMYIVSTSKGMKSDREARKLRLGGEVIARVW